MALFLFPLLFPNFLFFPASEQLEFLLPSAQILPLLHPCPPPPTLTAHSIASPDPGQWALQCLLQAGSHMERLPSVPSLSPQLSGSSTHVTPFFPSGRDWGWLPAGLGVYSLRQPQAICSRHGVLTQPVAAPAVGTIPLGPQIPHFPCSQQQHLSSNPRTSPQPLILFFSPPVNPSKVPS